MHINLRERNKLLLNHKKPKDLKAFITDLMIDYSKCIEKKKKIMKMLSSL